MGWLQDPLLFFKVKRGVGIFGATEIGSPSLFVAWVLRASVLHPRPTITTLFYKQ